MLMVLIVASPCRDLELDFILHPGTGSSLSFTLHSPMSCIVVCFWLCVFNI